jgi:hypothetical protein
MPVPALMGPETIRAAYAHAIGAGYRYPMGMRACCCLSDAVGLAGKFGFTPRLEGAKRRRG